MSAEKKVAEVSKFLKNNVRRAIWPLRGPVKALNRILRHVSTWTHHLQFQIEWRYANHPPEWFDHYLDQYWRWPYSRNPMSWERGIFGALAMKPGCRVLDLCCGGGFFSYHFYSLRASKVIAVDLDPIATQHARRNFIAPNLEYRCADVRTGMPAGKFDNVVWDAAIEHFTEAEISAILGQIKGRLGSDGILSGYTIVERDEKSHPDHEYEFKSKADLAQILKPHFKNLRVFETQWSDALEARHNLYFYASDRALPFDDLLPELQPAALPE
jgi:SAM-dependent methyltransferase